MKKTLFIVLAIIFPLFCSANIGPITGSSNICAGSSVSLSDTTAGGTWSSSNPATAYVGSASGIVTGLTAGTATITYSTVTGYVTQTVTVNSTPSVYTVTGGGGYCTGGGGVTVGLSGSSPGINYQLMYGTSPIGVPFVGTGTPISFGWQTGGGTYTVVATDAATGCARAMSGSATITVNPTSVISGPSAVCAGASITLLGYGSFYGGAWLTSNPAIATISSAGVVTGMAVGTATITYSSGLACYTTHTVTVSPSPAPISMASSLCVGEAVTLTNSVAGGLWSSSSPLTADVGSISGSVIGIATGTATITYSLGTGCVVTRPITINASPLPILGLSSVCTGGAIMLTDGMPGGKWKSDVPYLAFADSITGNVRGYAVGLATISYTMPSGCSASRLVTVTPGSCSGTPTGGTAIASSPIACPGTSETITLSGTSLGCGVILQWQNSTDGITYNDIPGAYFPTYSYIATTDEFVRCKVICTSSGLFAYSAPTHVPIRSSINSHAIIPPPDSLCTATDFYISACGISSTYSVTTVFGDGSFASTPLTSSGICHADVTHTYNLPGTYVIKQVLFNGAMPQDTVSFSYEARYCSVLPVKFYFDANNNCFFDSGDKMMLLPIITEIDSDGIPIDTISSTSGFYYKAAGSAGTVYAFRVISAPSGFTFTCPISGIVYDTIQSSLFTYTPKYMAFGCEGTAALAIDEYSSARTGRHMQTGTIILNSRYCPATNVVVYLQFSPKYEFLSATPYPSAISGNTIKWNISNITDTNLSIISYTLSTPAYSDWLLAGDTAISKYITVDASGLDTSNIITNIDTVKASYDPNELTVSPSGYVLPCTQLQYTVRFENTGNDTAHNISIVDTLSDNLDIHSLRVELASSVMNISTTKNSGHNIVKFDFPNINLLDSTHSNQCDGMLVFNIKALAGLPDGTAIPHHVGIFFDDNPAVQTNTIVTIIGISPISGHDSVCITAHDTLSNNTNGGIWTISNANATILSGILSGVSAGLDTVYYTVRNTCTSKTASKTVRINAVPAVGTITGSNAVCAGAILPLMDTIHGGIWLSSSPATAVIDSYGHVAGLSAGHVAISYTKINSCGMAIAAKEITVNPLPAAITGASFLCIGVTGRLSDISAGGVWSSSHSTIASIDSASGILAGLTAGTSVIIYTLPTGCLVSHSLTVNPLPSVPTGSSSLCVGATSILADSSLGGIWSSSIPAIASIDSLTGIVIGFGTGTATITYQLPTGCMQPRSLAVKPVPASISGSPSLCMGSVIPLADDSTGGKWSSSDLSVAIIGSATGLVTGISTGNATMTYTQSTGCFATYPMTINPIPAIYSISGGGNYCAGDSGVHIALSGSSNRVNYALLHGSAVSGTLPGTEGILDFGLQTLAGEYIVQATNSITGCQSYMADTAFVRIIPIVTPHVSINANPSDTICAGTPVTFIPISLNGGTAPIYLWKVNGIAKTTGGDYTCTPADSDVVAVLLVSNAICAKPDTVGDSLIINASHPLRPSISFLKSPDIIKQGDSLTLTAKVARYGSAPTYHWVLNWSYIAGATDSVYTSNSLQNNDSLTCIITTSNSCGEVIASNGIVIPINQVGIKQFSNDSIHIFPNPTTVKFTLDYNFDNDALLQLTDIAGHIIISKNLSNTEKRKTLDIQDFSPGLYLYKILQNKTVIRTGKVIKN